MKNFFDDQKGSLIEEESAVLSRSDDFLERERLGVKIKSCRLREGEYEEARYVSIDCSRAKDKDALKVLGEEFTKFLSVYHHVRSVLCCGIGNPYVTCDALGAKTIQKLTDLSVSGLKLTLAMPFGLTGIQSQNVVDAIVKSEGVDMCIVIDALSARGYEKLGNTYQFTDSGIVPGSAVGGKRAIDDGILGVPVIAIGVPTVIRGCNIGAKKVGDKLFTSPDVEKLVEVASIRLSSTITRAFRRIRLG